MTARSRPIHILGAGALGSLWAAGLATDHDVVIVPRSNKPLPASYNFTLQNAHGTHNYSLPLFDPASPIETLLIFTKSYDVLPALQQLANTALSKNTSVILFQNGLGSQQQVLLQFPDNPVFAAMTTEGANRRDGTIIHAGSGETRIGPLNDKAGKIFTSGFHNLFKQSGFSIQFESNIWPALWLKLAINCAINPFTALLDCPNGQLSESKLFQEKWPKLREELSQMLQQAGCPLAPEPEAAGIELEKRIFGVMENTASNISSMLQDVRAGKTTEIDDINGYASRFLKQHGLPFECNQWLWERVSSIRVSS